jgi:hypothetical protein
MRRPSNSTVPAVVAARPAINSRTSISPSRRADDGEEFAVAEVEIDGAQRMQRLVATRLGKDFGHPAQRHVRRH